MKKILALVLALVLAVGLVACGGPSTPTAEPSVAPTAQPSAAPSVEPTPEPTPEPGADVMTHAEYVAAPLDSAVVIEAYVQDHQSWWDNKITVYAQDNDGGYFMYEMACSEEDAAKLVPGTKIRVSGYKAEWAGEVEIVDATFEILEGSYIAEPLNVTELLGTDELIKYQNMAVCFKGMIVEKIEYKNDEPGDDIYVTVSYNGQSYDFCVERYLTGPETEVYQAVGALTAGDLIDIEGFLYWYEGANPHITSVSEAKSEGVMSYAEYAAAEIDSAVVIEAYVQDHQSWWDNKITVYAQDKNGGYFMYEMACSEEDAAKLVPGTKIRVTGYKAEWAGEVEIVDATFEILEGSYIAEPLDVTELLGTDELVKYQNMAVCFKGMTVEKIEYKNDEPGDDIYVTVSYNGQSYDFCVERYLTGPETEVYQAVGALAAGDQVDIVGFLYWYEGVNTHITGVTASK